jgi:hypothetical protein
MVENPYEAPQTKLSGMPKRPSIPGDCFFFGMIVVAPFIALAWELRKGAEHPFIVPLLLAAAFWSVGLLSWLSRRPVPPPDYDSLGPPPTAAPPIGPTAEQRPYIWVRMLLWVTWLWFGLAGILIVWAFIDMDNRFIHQLWPFMRNSFLRSRRCGSAPSLFVGGSTEANDFRA